MVRNKSKPQLEVFITLLAISFQFPFKNIYNKLDETCGEIPDEFAGTGQSTAGIFVKKIKQVTSNDLFKNLEFLYTATIVHSKAVITVLKSTPDRSDFIDEDGKSISEIFVGTRINTTDTDGQLTAQFREFCYIYERRWIFETQL
ncbi:unnamed protein product [Allacma fusca]|uniref:Uncharacterized protein n=1 Tax=Allacma fusca TaxID=39272 RepID=A0A8J2LH26_9HEXA|nr:unnamed protein product [Allacma fusca]